MLIERITCMIRSETRIKEIQPRTPALEIYRFTLQRLFHSKICRFIASPIVRLLN